MFSMVGHIGRELLTVGLKKVGCKEGSRWLQFKQSVAPDGTPATCEADDEDPGGCY